VIAALPQIVVDMGALAGVTVALSTLTALVWRTPPVRWLRDQIREDREERLEAAVAKAVQPLAAKVDQLVEDFEKHQTYVGHHLGPNDTTKPVHERLISLEIAHGIED
jgi:hypothetical protein